MSSTPPAITQGQLALDIIGWVLLIACLAAILYALVGVLLLPVWGLGAVTGARRLRAWGRGWWYLPSRIVDHATAYVQRLTAPRDPERYARPQPQPRERDAASTAGIIVLWGLALVGGLLLITTGEQHVVQPLAGGRAVAEITVAAILLTVALAAGAPRLHGGRDVWSTNLAMRQAERDVALQAQRAYERTITDRQAKKAGAGATPGRASQRPSSGKAARQTSKPQRSAL
jgi:hypothetical protein